MRSRQRSLPTQRVDDARALARHLARERGERHRPYALSLSSPCCQRTGDLARLRLPRKPAGTAITCWRCSVSWRLAGEFGEPAIVARHAGTRSPTRTASGSAPPNSRPRPSGRGGLSQRPHWIPHFATQAVVVRRSACTSAETPTTARHAQPLVARTHGDNGHDGQPPIVLASIRQSAVVGGTVRPTGVAWLRARLDTEQVRPTWRVASWISPDALSLESLATTLSAG